MVGKRKRGEKYPLGFIKNQIILEVARKYPSGIDEPDLRRILKIKWGVRETRGIKEHLSELGSILTKKRNQYNVWNINPDQTIFEKIAWDFLGSENKFKFINSKYAQAMLTNEFLNARANYIYNNYWIPLKETLEKEKPEFLQILQPLSNLLPLPEINKEKITVNLTGLFRKSPLALRILLFPEKIIWSKETNIIMKHIRQSIPELSVILDIFRKVMKKSGLEKAYPKLSEISNVSEKIFKNKEKEQKEKEPALFSA